MWWEVVGVRLCRQSSVIGGEKGRDFEKPFSRKTFVHGVAALEVILRGWSVGQPLLASHSAAGSVAPGGGASRGAAYSVTGEPGKAAAVCTELWGGKVELREGDYRRARVA